MPTVPNLQRRLRQDLFDIGIEAGSGRNQAVASGVSFIEVGLRALAL